MDATALLSTFIMGIATYFRISRECCLCIFQRCCIALLGRPLSPFAMIYAEHAKCNAAQHHAGHKQRSNLPAYIGLSLTYTLVAYAICVVTLSILFYESLVLLTCC